jgi:hypothetical protein
MKLKEAVILLHWGQGSKSHRPRPLDSQSSYASVPIFPTSHQATLLISMLTVITFISTCALGQKMGARRQYNGRHRICHIKCCHPHHLWDISVWPQDSCYVTSISLGGKIITNATYSYSSWMISVFDILIRFGNIHEVRTTVLNLSSKLRYIPSVNIIYKSS